MAWWRHITASRRTSQKFASYSYFTKLNTLSLKIDLIFFVKNLWECENFSHRRLIKEFSTKYWKSRTLDRFLRKLLATGSIERTVMIDFKMCCLYVVLVSPGIVETQLGKVVNFVNFCPLVQKLYKSTKKNQSYNQKQSGTFFMAHGVYDKQKRAWISAVECTMNISIRSSLAPSMLLLNGYNSTHADVKPYS